MVDLDRLQYRLELLRGYMTELRRLRDLELRDYLREAYAGRYLVQVAAQTCIDLAAHVVASEAWRSPRDFGDGFTVLCENGILDAALAGRLRGLAGLRNRLVHVYDTIDDERGTRSAGRRPGRHRRLRGRDRTSARLAVRGSPDTTA